MGEAPLKPSLIFPFPVEESNPDLLISNENQSLITASDGMRDFDGFSFVIRAPEGLQPNGFESILNPIPELMWLGCCMLFEKDPDFFNEDHPPSSCKRLFDDEIINLYIFWKRIFYMNFLVYSTSIAIFLLNINIMMK